MYIQTGDKLKRKNLSSGENISNASVQQGSLNGLANTKMIKILQTLVTIPQPSFTPMEDFGPMCKTMLSTTTSIKSNDII